MRSLFIASEMANNESPLLQPVTNSKSKEVSPSLHNELSQQNPVSMISYSKKTRKDAAAKEPDQPVVPTSPTVSTLPSGTRRVLSHRKKLQEFYKLHAESQGEQKVEEVKEEPKLSRTEQLKDSRALKQFTKESTAQEMLKVRNEIALKLNFHDLEKKTIIYDNYSELIKLDQTLGSVKNGTLEPQDEDRFVVNPKHGKQNFREILLQVQGSVEKEAAIFNQDFQSVISSILTNPQPSESEAI